MIEDCRKLEGVPRGHSRWIGLEGWLGYDFWELQGGENGYRM